MTNPDQIDDGEPSVPADDPMRPVLSVIIACLNAADTIGTQLEALAGQWSPVEWEVLVCDNGSTDHSMAVAERFRGRLSNLRVLDASVVRGAGPARNYGVHHALGDWVAFCDADDEVAPDWVASMARALAEHRFVAGRFESHRLNGGRVLRSRPLQQQSELQSSDIGARLPHAGGGNMGIHRQDFLDLTGFDPQIPWLEDTDFSWRAQAAGVPLEFCPDAVVHVRLRQTFRSMYVQGRQYGLAHALLEERYGRPEPAGAPVAVGSGPKPTVASGPVATAWRVLCRVVPTVNWVVDHLVAGRLAWRIGWVVGHRSHRRGQAFGGGRAGARRGVPASRNTGQPRAPLGSKSSSGAP